jgi:glycosyltransferase involved in cell wall biosynthesis
MSRRRLAAAARIPRVHGLASPVASVVVPAWDSGERIVPTLEALLGQDLREPFEVVVVESGERGCGPGIREAFPAVRFVRSRARLLAGQARNRGVDAARGRWIAFCSDDCVPGGDWLRLRVAKHLEGFDLVGGSVTNGSPFHPVGIADYFVEHTAVMPSHRILPLQAVPHLVSYDRQLLARAGPFPEDTPTGEDSVLNRRCVELGATVGFEPRASFAHRGPTGFRAFLRHHARHGRGYTRCVEFYGHRSLGKDLAHMWLAYPLKRWVRGLRRVAVGRPGQVPLYLAVAPLTVCGHVAIAVGARRERAALAQT